MVTLQVKMEQDLAMRQAEEEAMRHHQFKANPLPKSTTEPRYQITHASIALLGKSTTPSSMASMYCWANHIYLSWFTIP